MGGQGDMCPILFEVEWTPYVLSPLLFGGRHFCTNAYGIRWMIGAIFVEFSQLILTKITKIVATRCHILRSKCTNSILAGALPQILLEKLTLLPQTP